VDICPAFIEPAEHDLDLGALVCVASRVRLAAIARQGNQSITPPGINRKAGVPVYNPASLQQLQELDFGDSVEVPLQVEKEAYSAASASSLIRPARSSLPGSSPVGTPSRWIILPPTMVQR
jgi:hypothetical protein